MEGNCKGQAPFGGKFVLYTQKGGLNHLFQVVNEYCLLLLSAKANHLARDITCGLVVT